MTDQSKIIQDISLLYELSLSVGGSLDFTENAKTFLDTLISRKGLAFASVWAQNGKQFELQCGIPRFRVDQTVIEESHPIPSKLKETPFFSIHCDDPDFTSFIQEKDIESGTYCIFSLKEVGFLKLFALNRKAPFSKLEMGQLNSVITKFAVSLKGCLAHKQLFKETEERQEAEKALKATNEQLADLFDNMYDALIILDNDGFITEANKAARCMLGYPEDEHPHIDIKSILHPDDQERAFEYYKLLLKNDFYSGYEGRITQRDGSIIHIEVNSNAIYENGKMTGSRNLLRDVTERINAEKALRESEEKYRGIIENMELGLLEVGLDQTIVRPYPIFCDMVGYTAEELIGKNAEELFLPEEFKETLHEQEAERRQGMAGVYEIQIKRKDGSRIWVLISGAPIKDKKGRVVGSVGIHYDITARRELEQNLSRAKDRAEKAQLAERQFLANMSHEIRTPMNAVIGMTHLLYETTPNETQKEYLDSLRFSADSLMGIINNILDLSKIGAGEVEFEYKPFDLVQLLHSLQRTFQFKVREKPISTVLDIDSKIKNLVIGDSTRLNQIFTNLLGNASKFTQRGTIGIRAKVVSESAAEYVIEFHVHDTGIGIAKEKQEAVFQNFKQADLKITREFGGTGLGLTIVKELVELQSGSIRLESELGRGSTFVVTMPFKNSGVPISEKVVLSEGSSTDIEAVLKDLRVLLVEDNLMNQKLASRILEKWGATYQIAGDGVKAVEASKASEYDLILMDIHMPHMDGCEATIAIRGDADNPNQGTPIIALTAAALLEEKTRALDAGMNDFVTKPFSPRILKEQVLKALGFKRPILPKQSKGSDAKIKIDLKYLQEFSGGDVYFIRDMLETFMREAPATFVRVQNAFKEENWEGLYKGIHKIKPSFMMLGLQEQYDKAAKAESDVRGDTFEVKTLKEIVDQLQQDTQHLIPVIQSTLNELTKAALE
ncbi:MAG: PAS domain S-box protein [Saprospiraceae bacterium]|nr:PAS domain S-box protein [Saprospiraceae bacterium]